MSMKITLIGVKPALSLDYIVVIFSSSVSTADKYPFTHQNIALAKTP